MILSFDDIIEQIKSIQKSIDSDSRAINEYKECLKADPMSVETLIRKQILTTLQGNIATKQLRITMLQLGLRDI